MGYVWIYDFMEKHYSTIKYSPVRVFLFPGNSGSFELDALESDEFLYGCALNQLKPSLWSCGIWRTKRSDSLVGCPMIPPVTPSFPMAMSVMPDFPVLHLVFGRGWPQLEQNCEQFGTPKVRKFNEPRDGPWSKLPISHSGRVTASVTQSLTPTWPYLTPPAPPTPNPRFSYRPHPLSRLRAY